MITPDNIMSISKSNLQEASKALHIDDIPQLIEWLNLKDDNVRYQVFLLLQNRSFSAMMFIRIGILLKASCKAITPIREASD